MTNLTPELIAKAKAAKSAEELLELAKENNVELTEEVAKTCFEQLHTNAAISDDELEAVAGGGICEHFEDLLRLIFGDNESGCSHLNGKTNATNSSYSPKTTNSAYKANVTNLPYQSNSPASDNSITTLPYTSNDKNKIVLL